MENDLISRKALLDSLRESKDELRKIYDGLNFEIEKRLCGAQLTAFCEAILRVKKAPAIEAEPVRHGVWAKMVNSETGKFAGYRCSECGIIEKRKFNYCHCGAKMDAKEDDHG